MIEVYWEDSRAPNARSFGPHGLLCACVADRLHGDRWVLGSRLRGVPVRGRDKVIGALKAPGHHKRLGVIDSDEAHHGIPGAEKGKTTAEQVKEHRLSGHRDVELFLIERNTESLLAAVLRCEGAEDAAGSVVKDRVMRDTLCMRAAAADRALRQCIENAVPSFTLLVEAVVSMLKADGGSGSLRQQSAEE